jgi:hypothetical protein
MAKLSKTLQLKIDATDGIKSLNDINKLLKETQDELSGLQIGSTEFNNTLADVKELENGLTSLTKSTSESFLQIADFAKTAGEAFFQTVSIIGLYTSSTDEASLITAKLANVFALVGTAEKAFQTISQGTVLYQELKAELALKEATALALNTEAIAVNTTVEAANTTGTIVNTTAQTAQTSSLLAQAAAWAILNPLTAIAATTIVGITSAYFILTKSVTEILEKQDKENKRLKDTNDALISVKEATLELAKARKLLNGISENQAEIEFRIEEANLLRENIALQEEAFNKEKQQLADIQKIRSEGFARLRRDIFGENADTLIAIQEKENAIRESEARITLLRAKEIQKRKDIENDALDNDRKISKARQDQALEQLATETSINAKRQSAQIEYNSAIADLDNEVAKGKLTQSERNRAAFLEEDKLRSRNIELLREERNEALEARNITREGIIKDLEVKNDIASQFLVIQLEQQQAEDELAVAILNKEIPAIQQTVKQQEIKNETLRKTVLLQEQINELLLESERNTAILQLEELTRRLNETTGDFREDYINDLKIIEAESIEANEKIRVEFEKRFKEVGDNPELKKALKTELDAALSNAKSIEEAKKKERKKGFVVEIEEENVKNVAIEELQRGSLERQLQKDTTTFEERKKLNQALLDLEVKRLRAQEALQIAQAGKNQAEIDRIKQTTDEAIKTAEGLTEVANKKIDDNILTKIFGSPEDINDYIRGSQNITAAIRSTVEALDKVITGNAGDNFKAINLAIAETQELTTNLVETINSFGENDTTAERVAGIVQLVGTTLIAITNIVNDAIQSVIERSIENVDKEIDAINTRKDELEEEINNSASRLKELEDNLQKAKLADREAIIKAIEQERLKEGQLAKEKQKALNDEIKANEKKKELQKKAFQAQKAAAIATAIINTAISVTQAYATVPPPANLIVAALYGGLGAAQVAAIAAQPVPEFRQGGFTASDRDDSKPVGVVHANEYVVPAPIVRSPRFRPMLEDIERARLSKNGYQSGGIVTANDDVNSAQVTQAIEAAIALSNRPIYASIIDIDAAQGRQLEIVDQTTL